MNLLRHLHTVNLRAEQRRCINAINSNSDLQATAFLWVMRNRESQEEHAVITKWKVQFQIVLLKALQRSLWQIGLWNIGLYGNGGLETHFPPKTENWRGSSFTCMLHGFHYFAIQHKWKYYNHLWVNVRNNCIMCLHVCWSYCAMRLCLILLWMLLMLIQDRLKYKRENLIHDNITDIMLCET